MKTKKLYSDLTTSEEFLEYWKDAGKREINQRIKTIGNHGLSNTEKNELSALKCLLL